MKGLSAQVKVFQGAAGGHDQALGVTKF